MVDFMTNAVAYGGVAFLAGGYSASLSLDNTLDLLLHTPPYILYMAAGSISSTLPDISGDRDEGKHTTAVVLGARNAHLLACVLLLGAIWLFYLQKDFFGMWIAVSALPLYLLFLVYPTTLLMELVYKVGGAIAMVAISMVYPLFFIVGITTFIFTLLYFRMVHHVLYPSLRSDSE
ncbi:hypothetical protein CALK_0829 [Chitinivibrio alkaliphilus ACht1]|uniref:Uncharacterized protein n=1 Tax=Chitinivibrio alkaliphilus ACht1 TaxID=1313304 RepID=U7D841_9BACT|nr:hypothetical protein CALK_0829 [Chitinivibrio alkaliphilus ACht1]